MEIVLFLALVFFGAVICSAIGDITRRDFGGGERANPPVPRGGLDGGGDND